MKKAYLLFIMCMLTGALSAQHELVGTWEMISIAGTNADGEPFFLDTTTVRETKIITPTHYILIARDKENGKWIFNRCYAGEARVEGSKYFEKPLLSSLRIFDNVTTDFEWIVDGDRFIQSGTITRPDGRKVIIKEFVFRRLLVTPRLEGDPGTFKLVVPRNDEGLLVLTPTHWMMIVKDSKALINASGGTYSGASSDISAFTVNYTSDPVNRQPVPFKFNGERVTFSSYVFEKVK